MKLCTIFADHLWSVKYDDGNKDVLNELFDKWEDVEYLYDFFINHMDLVNNSPWKDCSVDELVVLARDESFEFYDRFCEIFDNNEKNFDDEFVFLSQNAYEWPLEKCKSYGYVHNWSVRLHRNALLRLYAIRVDNNQYVITGGGIKLVKEMHEMPELVQELDKLDKVRRWLQSNKVEISKEVDSLLEEE